MNRASATRLNVSNFTYLLDYYAFLLCQERRAKGIGPEKCNEKSITNSTDSFQKMWKTVPKRSFQDESFRRLAIEPVKSSEDGFWSYFYSSFEAIWNSLKSIKWVLIDKTLNSSPIDADFHNSIKENIKELQQSAAKK